MDCILAATANTAKEGHVINLWKRNAGSSLSSSAAPSSSSSLTSNDHKVAVVGSATYSHHCLQGHTNWIVGVAFSRDNAMLASCSQDNLVIVWDTGSGRELARIVQDGPYSGSVCFNSTGEKIVSNASNCIRIWDYPKRRVALLIPNKCDVPAVGIFLVRRDSIILTTGCNSAGRDVYLKCWSSETGEEAACQEFSDIIVDLACSPYSDSEEVAIAFQTGRIVTWDLVERRSKLSISAHCSNVSGLCYDVSGCKLFSSSWDQTLKTWDATSGELLSIVEAANSVCCLSISPLDEICMGEINIGNASLESQLSWVISGEIVAEWKDISVGKLCWSYATGVILM
jgi:WD40 repeat protein